MLVQWLSRFYFQSSCQIKFLWENCSPLNAPSFVLSSRLSGWRGFSFWVEESYRRIKYCGSLSAREVDQSSQIQDLFSCLSVPDCVVRSLCLLLAVGRSWVDNVTPDFQSLLGVTSQFLYMLCGYTVYNVVEIVLLWTLNTHPITFCNIEIQCFT